MLSLLQHPQAEMPIADIGEPPQKGLHGITSKLRQTVSKWENKNWNFIEIHNFFQKCKFY